MALLGILEYLHRTVSLSQTLDRNIVDPIIPATIK